MDSTMSVVPDSPPYQGIPSTLEDESAKEVDATPTPSRAGTSRLTRKEAPGKRGPTPTSCQGCRKLRSKCVRPLGGKVGEETCVGCSKRGIECKIPQEISRYRKVDTVESDRAQNLKVESEISTGIASGLAGEVFDIQEGDSPTALRHLSQRSVNFEIAEEESSSDEATKQISRSEQLNLQILWTKLARHESNFALDEASTFIARLQQIADSSAAWRTPTRSNFRTLILLFSLLKIQGQTEARHYFSSAINQFRQLFRVPSDLVGTNGEHNWFAYRFALIDSQIALESKAAPLLSQQDYTIFSPSSSDRSFYLPPPALLLHVDFQAAHQASSPLAGIAIPAMRYYLHLAQPLAIYFSQTLQQPAAKKDLETIQWAWEKIDPYGAWVIESLDALRSISPSTSTQTLASTTLKYLYTLALILECSILEYLGKRFETVSSSMQVPAVSDDIEDLSLIGSLYSQSVSRYETLVCQFLRSSRNLDRIYQLIGIAGHTLSVERLNSICTVFCGASTGNKLLFPQGLLDKLASATFLLETLEAHFRKSSLGDSIELVKTLVAQLESASVCSGVQALKFSVKMSSESSATLL